MDRKASLPGDVVEPDSAGTGTLTVAQRQAAGKALRDATPRSSHAAWAPASDRPDPIDLLEAQAQTRISELVPIRYGRMLASPFAFLRGAAVVMARDVASAPTTGLTVQLCGDCHLANFGVYASPERMLLFDINDFDETLPGPWEWDLKRLAASFLVAARTVGLRPPESRAVVLRLVETYRTQMQTFAQQTTLDVWYARLSVEDVLRLSAPQQHKRIEAGISKAQTHHNLQELSKLTALQDGVRRIVADPPVVTPVESADLRQNLRAIVRGYRETLQNDRRHLLEAYRLVDLALKVVGVGAVGTHCYIALFTGRDDNDPLFLQLKQAEASVLEAYLPRSQYRQHGRRVVAGQRLMQASSDIFLGWTRSLTGRDYYVRQLRDMKYSVPLEKLSQPQGWLSYAQVCGWTLARAHARSGDRVKLAAYIGNSPRLDEAIANFAEAYAEQTERDYAAFQAAVKSGRIKAQTGV
jgi:uncharacterized protein (DUF2252 family)